MDAATDDPRAARSKRALIAAATALLDANDLDELSITQVVAAAGVTRPTFYQHFGDLAELARAAAVARLDEEFTRHEPASPSASDVTRVEPVVRELLEHLAAHRDFYRRVLHGPRSGAAVNAAVDLVARRILERSPLLQSVAEPDTEEVRDGVVIVSGGIVWLLSGWLGTRLTGRDSVEAMAHRITVQLMRLGAASDR